MDFFSISVLIKIFIVQFWTIFDTVHWEEWPHTRTRLILFTFSARIHLFHIVQIMVWYASNADHYN